ncbi:MAG TPA: VCBS repeat-containing protein [Pirellulaceae bacterium]|jgi:hypothetical protein|nr:VCBS repeat-containing protein [Pirellulaceae bacterium]
MRSSLPAVLLTVAVAMNVAATRLATAEEEFALHTFERQQLTGTYYSEGAGVGDIDGDGKKDVVYGPYWFKGPEFTTQREIYPAKPQNTDRYADNFFSWLYDFDGDGANDVLTAGFPGTPAFVYRNPGPEKLDRHWEKIQVFDSVANESPQFVDLVGDERPELVCTTEGAYGFVTIDWERPLEAWTFRRISEKTAPKPFGHGLGVGDVNGDGRKDILIAEGWFEQPAEAPETSRWTFHEGPFTDAYGGAEMYAEDVDGDGDADVIGSHAAHEYGLAWYEQIDDEVEIAFRRRLIVGKKPEENRHGLLFTEMHSVAMADLDGDGAREIVTGKTYRSHHDRSPLWDAGAVAYRFAPQKKKGGLVWVPFLIDGEAGIGRQIVVDDVDGDGLLDVVTGGMKGCQVLRHRKQTVDRETYEKSIPPILHDEAPVAPPVEKARFAIDAESMKVVRVTGGNAAAQSMAGFAGGPWSGGKQLFWRGGKIGDELTLEFDVPNGGLYEIAVGATKAPDYGVVSIQLDEETIAAESSLHGPKVATTVIPDKMRLLRPGKHRLTFKIVAAAEGVEATFVGIDYLQLLPINP